MRLFLLLIGATVGWSVYGWITGEFFVEILPVILICTATGYLMGRKEQKKSNKVQV